MSQNPYEPPQTECRSHGPIDYASIVLASGLTAIFAGIAGHIIAADVLRFVGPYVDNTASNAFMRWMLSNGAAVGVGVAWFVLAYVLQVQRARRNTS